MRYVVRNAVVVDGTGADPFPADISIRGATIETIGRVPPEAGDVDIDAQGRLAMPGFIDAHSHVDGALFDEGVQLALLRQGVTTVIGGQDGVSYAPGDGRYATEYFSAINGAHPSYRGARVADLLDTFDEATRVNFAYLIPAGTVRFEVMGRSTAPATDDEIHEMRRLVVEGLDDGALGISSGLDYVPGIFADTAELAQLCAPVADAGAVYVTHMRGGYEANSAEGLDEIARISDATGVRAHISHFHAEADTLLPLLTDLRARGVDVSFDAYPYTRGCTLLAMPLLPPELAVLPVDGVLDELQLPGRREALRSEWFPLVAEKPSLGRDWPAMITLGHIGAEEYGWAHGLTIEQASRRAGIDAIDFALDLLIASRLDVNAIMAVRYTRSIAELGRILASDAHIGGSDGIFIGAHPHPRARGTFTSYLREYVRETGVWSWADATVHLSSRPAQRFGLVDRGVLVPGAVADLVLVDPETVSDRSTYEEPLAISQGIADVLVAGTPVLVAGQLAPALAGRGLRRFGSEL